MLTVKLLKKEEGVSDILYSTKIVEGRYVDIHALRPGSLAQISVTTEDSLDEYYVASEVPADFAEGSTVYYAAYVENSMGSTIHVVKP